VVEDKQPQEWSLDGVLHELGQINKTMPDRQFVFILGAGASVTSGIPSGHRLAQRWLNHIHLRECTEGHSVNEWLKDCGLGDGSLTEDTAGEHYAEIFERRFNGDREAGYAELESAMEGKSPSLGYSLLAEIIQQTRHKVVVTTNFDNLVADALSMHAHQSPLVVAHESLAGFVRPQLRRPLVAKIHRDLFLNPINDPDGVSIMEQGWKIALRKVFQYFTPIVVGYGGNDGSLMDMLLELNEEDIAGRMVWCCRSATPLPLKARDLLNKQNGLVVRIDGFDEFMLLLADKLVDDFDVTAIAERTAKIGEQRAERYRKQIEQLQKSTKRGSDYDKKAGAVLDKSVSESDSWWAWELKAKSVDDLEERNRIYLEGLEKFPKSAELAGNYANFLRNVRKENLAAEMMYKKALGLDPKNSQIICNYAIYLTNSRKEHEEAEGMYKKALELDPKNALIAQNYANFLKNVRKEYGAAEALYKKALELDPKNSQIVCDYATLLTAKRKDLVAAEAMHKRALELDENDQNIKANYAYFLLIKEGVSEWKSIMRYVKQVQTLSKPEISQTLAEALLYGAIVSELNEKAHHEVVALAQLKGTLSYGFQRGSWEFTQLYEIILPQLPTQRHVLYKAIAEAILDEEKLPELEALSDWQEIQAADPFE